MKNVLRTAAALALLLLAPAALAQSRTAARSSGGLTHANVLVGFEDGDGNTGLALRGDVEMLPTRIAPNANVSLVLSLGYTRFADSYYGWEWNINLFKLVPAARFSFDVAPRFGLYGDAGLGMYFGNATVKERDPYYGTWTRASNSDVGLMMRLAAGAKFDLTPTFALGAELGVNPYFGDYDNTTFSGMLLASFRM
ncbi:outer membrane beta-barrel protein [Anaeromyxobacter terrae]|uniref:outer membrane beta-barrel protein n=1 Tax=Anaeromyxobacter terrae TaxID=2925406 RepID=UPI001F55CAF1|nr:outer membrane beta-barrel protein [Anaeromyxobacter sp. SG22]